MNLTKTQQTEFDERLAFATQDHNSNLGRLTVAIQNNTISDHLVWATDDILASEQLLTALKNLKKVFEHHHTYHSFQSLIDNFTQRILNWEPSNSCSFLTNLEHEIRLKILKATLVLLQDLNS